MLTTLQVHKCRHRPANEKNVTINFHVHVSPDSQETVNILSIDKNQASVYVDD